MAENSAPSVSTELKPYVETDRMELIRVAIAGLVAGLAIPLLGMAITSGLILPFLCGDGATAAICADPGALGYHAAAVVVALVVLVLFANWGVYRPLPLVAAITVALWGFRGLAEPLAALEFYVAAALLSALCYLLFYWLLRLRNFPASILLTAAVTALVAWVSVA